MALIVGSISPSHFPTFSLTHFQLAFGHERYRHRKLARCPRPLWSVWRTVCARDVDASVAGTGGRIFSLPARPGFPARVAILPEGILWPAHAALFRRTPDTRTGRGENLSQARGLAPHWRAQDQ